LLLRKEEVEEVLSAMMLTVQPSLTDFFPGSQSVRLSAFRTGFDTGDGHIEMLTSFAMMMMMSSIKDAPESQQLQTRTMVEAILYGM
jgi:hypothetical protein